ncbi:MAG TPA: hypothetical protein VN807_08000 [Candidatus Sulfotelmatobacter sp.]|nr:hypothetical protein [Candidatus Sulfotelmatobacter sp.]
MWHIRAFIPALLLLASGLPEWGQTEPVTAFVGGELTAKEMSAKAPVIVIGFVGGFVRRDDSVHSGVQLAARIHDAYPSGVYVKVFENRRREQAHQEIVKILDTDHDGTLSDKEKRDARIVIYGMSWGGSETVELARELEAEKIPVLLTIQVDSVAKRGQDDALIPPNVAEAVNFYQPDGLLHGQPEIHAVDPSRTRILGNYRYEYRSKSVRCENYPWYDRVFARQHTEIECDPAVWNRVESLIRSKLPLAGGGTAEGGVLAEC